MKVTLKWATAAQTKAIAKLRMATNEKLTRVTYRGAPLIYYELLL